MGGTNARLDYTPAAPTTTNGLHTHRVNVAPFASAVGGTGPLGTTAPVDHAPPYIQLRACRKD